MYGAARSWNRPPTPRAGLAVLVSTVASLLLLCWADCAQAQLYRWVDSAGTVYYTTDLATIPPAYRDGARDIGAPTPGPPQPSPPPAPAGVVIPYTGGPLMVDASINGVPLRLLLDTGADRTLISPVAMARAGFDVTRGTSVQLRGVTGDAVAILVSVPRLDLAGTRVGPVAVIVHTVNALTGQSVDGLLGRDVLDAFTLTMDSAGQRAILVPRQ
jgi:hypothetical protein